jgi:hypothetical protein
MVQKQFKKNSFPEHGARAIGICRFRASQLMNNGVQAFRTVKHFMHLKLFITITFPAQLETRMAFSCSSGRGDHTTFAKRQLRNATFAAGWTTRLGLEIE